ncbi:MAG: T9SS type A sorting domain-containing protein [Leadbetterella sp.]
MHRFILFLMLVITTKMTVAQIPTFSEQIAPIIYNNCTSCHRQGEVGPMAFTNYSEVKAWGKMIKFTTETRYMPPWSPDPLYRHFSGERTLTNSQIKQIADWVDGGMPQGDPSKEPKVPTFPTGSQVGTPDLVLKMADTYKLAGSGVDDYKVFVLPTNLKESKIVRAIEFRPGNNKVVHHVRLAYETKGAARAEDAKSPNEMGFDGFGGFNVQVDGSFDTWTPGKNVLQLPENIGHQLPANSDILIQVHYAPTSAKEVDQSSVNLFFKETPDLRPVKSFGMIHAHLSGGPQSFQIPANTVKNFYAKRVVQQDMSVMSVYPHAHYLCRTWEAYATTPKGDTIRLIKIKDWNNNWQGDYTLPRMIKIPSGSTVHAYATYDNTTNNPHNPSSPPQLVKLGEGSLEEMYVFGFTYIDFKEGDDKIALAPNTVTATSVGTPFEHKSRLYPVYPNPMNRDFSVGFYLDKPMKVNLSVYDLSGRIIDTYLNDSRSSGDHIVQIRLNDKLSSGMYFVKLLGDNLDLTQKIMVTN